MICADSYLTGLDVWLNEVFLLARRYKLHRGSGEVITARQACAHDRVCIAKLTWGWLLELSERLAAQGVPAQRYAIPAASRIWLEKTDAGRAFVAAIEIGAAPPDFRSALMGGASAPQPAAAPPRNLPPQPRPTPGSVISSGTGFYVNNTDLVSNAHVVEICETVELETGEKLAVVAIDPEADLALLQSPVRSKTFLKVSSDQKVRLTQQIYVAGFPLYGEYSDGLSITKGIASSANGFRGNPLEFTMDAPMQPGNSGGPVLDRFGHVVGVAVARLTDARAENVNYAVKRSALARMLENNGVAFSVGVGDASAISDGLPEDVQAAVAPLLCKN